MLDREGARARVHAGEIVELVGPQDVAVAGPVMPEVAEVGADGVEVPVEQLFGQRQAMEVLVPELALGLATRGPVAEARERRRDDERCDALGRAPRERLRHAAAHVVAAHDDALDAELVEESEHAGGLGVGAVERARVDVMAVGSAEAAQVGHDDLELAFQPLQHPVLVPPASRPAVQQDDGRPRPATHVAQTEVVDGRRPAEVPRDVVDHARFDLRG